MAKEVKVFTGSGSLGLNQTATIYTVPAGRVAKITIGFLSITTDISANSDTGTTRMSANGNIIAAVSVFASVRSATFPSGFAATSTSTSAYEFGGSNDSIVPSATGSTGRKYAYLPAGGTITFNYTSNSGGFGSYSYEFLVVEEF